MRNEADRRPLVLVLAGSGYGQQAPLLWWTSEIAAAAGCEVVAPRWHVDDAAGADPVGFVETAVAAALGDRLPDLVVAKSFGCFALPWAIRLEVPGVWLTPVLTHDDVATALAAASDAHVAIGGGDDTMWRPERVPGTAARLQTVDHADHSLQVPGDWRRSHRLQADVFDVVERRITALRPPMTTD
ncbi:hypothetical protein [Curtobacterium flaccumfaciens]|uniref:hypothetical protein n=1 Tax=Curtobacterium flaccumfaciens TaxID=2035 RepID=UPI001ADD619D|nr:hypothetical protein [Curtobacterium flaccumfaciens]MBO9041891.1 hypothetical protein [Curtobacterium flaccumfaciens pv. flaccumfaciens]